MMGFVPETVERLSLTKQYPNFGELQNETDYSIIRL
jgi:hypothetical protein